MCIFVVVRRLDPRIQFFSLWTRLSSRRVTKRMESLKRFDRPSMYSCMREHLQKRISDRREREEAGVGYLVGDHPDIFISVIILIIMRLFWIPPVARFCHWDYITFWTESHGGLPSILSIFTAISILMALWLLFRFALPANPAGKLFWPFRIVRLAVLLVVLTYGWTYHASVDAMAEHAKGTARPDLHPHWEHVEAGYWPEAGFDCPVYFKASRPD